MIVNTFNNWYSLIKLIQNIAGYLEISTSEDADDYDLVHQVLSTIVNLYSSYASKRDNLPDALKSELIDLLEKVK